MNAYVFVDAFGPVCIAAESEAAVTAAYAALYGDADGIPEARRLSVDELDSVYINRFSESASVFETMSVRQFMQLHSEESEAYLIGDIVKAVQQ